MKLRPRHLLGHGENCNTGGRHRLAKGRGIDSTFEDDGARLDLFGVQQKLRRLRRPRSDPDGEDDRAGCDRRALRLVVDHRLANADGKAARRRHELDDGGAETLEERFEVGRLVDVSRRGLGRVPRWRFNLLRSRPSRAACHCWNASAPRPRLQ